MENEKENMLHDKQEIEGYILEKVAGGMSLEELIRKMNAMFGIKSDISDSYNSDNQDSDIDAST